MCKNVLVNMMIVHIYYDTHRTESLRHPCIHEHTHTHKHIGAHVQYWGSNFCSVNARCVWLEALRRQSSRLGECRGGTIVDFQHWNNLNMAATVMCIKKHTRTCINLHTLAYSEEQCIHRVSFFPSFLYSDLYIILVCPFPPHTCILNSKFKCKHMFELLSNCKIIEVHETAFNGF